MTYNNGIGDWFVSDIAEKERESALLDAELTRKQQELMLEQMSKRKAMYSGSSSSDNTKYIILGGLSVVMLAVLILKM